MSGQPNLMGVIVCQCNVVSDRVIRKAVSRGASTVADLMVACDAGTCCGACHPELEALLALGRKAVTPGGSAPRPLADARRRSRW